MKRIWLLLVMMLLLPALCAQAEQAEQAEQAQDITARCVITGVSNKYKISRISDRDEATNWLSGAQKKPYFTVQTPEDEPCYGIYIAFGDEKLAPWEVQVKQDGKWTTAAKGAGLYAHEYLPLDGLTSFRVVCMSAKSLSFNVQEVFLLGRGELPPWVQVWQPAHEDADLLVISAHPDDELLFFGGAIPYYAAQRRLNVVVAYMTCGTTVRRSELLNGLWACGVRNYPDIGSFWDSHCLKLATGYEKWGKKATNERIVALYRKYKPEVVLTHDVSGEYGHGAHRVCADAAQACIAYAADAGKYTASAKAYGAWQVQKLYLHLYENNALEMDWDAPLSAFGGKTGYEVAQEAYKLHVSQQTKGVKGSGENFAVEPRDSAYSCYRFGLAFTTVGADETKNDLFENITIHKEAVE